jgi:hypothetical protein
MVDAVSEAPFWSVATVSYSPHLGTHEPGADEQNIQTHFPKIDFMLPAMLTGTAETGFAVYVMLAYSALRAGFLWIFAPSPFTHSILATVLVSATETSQRLAVFTSA